MNITWVREFNNLFARINHKGAPSYFSGNRFIGVVREFDPDFPDYDQYMALRASQGKSTSRKDYFYDILMSFSDSTRKEVIERISEITNEGEAMSIRDNAENVFGNTSSFSSADHLSNLTSPIISKLIDNSQRVDESFSEKNDASPTVFISYSWDDEEHKTWVLDLANQLIKNGVNILLDRYELKLGHNLSYFMENSLSVADKVLIILTPNYKLKADKRQGGVGVEYSILNADLYSKITNNDKYIPILRKGNSADSVPAFMQQFIRLDMKSGEQEEELTALLRAIYNEPELMKPTLGPRPVFSNALKPNLGLREGLYSILDKINPAIRAVLKNGNETVDVMISLANLEQLEAVKSEIERADLLSYRSNGNVIMGGSGNRIGNHINDLSEGFMQGFILKKLQSF